MSGELAKNVRRTLVVHSRYAWRSHRMGAALDGEQGLLPIPLEHLVARLAGGFLQPVNPDDLKDAVAAAIGEPLGELDAIKDLPGFQRAATASLSKAWSAGLSLDQACADDAAAQARIDSLAILEREVLARLPDNQLRPWDIAAAADRRIAHAGSIFGRIEIRGRTGMSPVWRQTLSRISQETDVVWVAEAREVPDWLPWRCFQDILLPPVPCS